jgi:hypothetical protein
MTMKVDKDFSFLAIFESSREYIKTFVITFVLSFIILLFSANQTGNLEETGTIAVLVFSLIISVILTLGLWLYNNVTGM